MYITKSDIHVRNNCCQSNGWTRKVNPKVTCEWRQGWSGILWALKRTPDQRAAFLARKTFGYLDSRRHNCVLMIQCVNRDVYNSFQFKFGAHVWREFKFSAIDYAKGPGCVAAFWAMIQIDWPWHISPQLIFPLT